MNVRRSMPWLILVVAGCTSLPQQQTASRAPHITPPARCVVFAVDGAGNFQGSSKALKAFVADENLPIHVHTFEWSHGDRRVLADTRDQAHARREGQRLAEQIVTYQRQGPEPPLPVDIVAHSAGCMVALHAAEQLPPESVEHVILLAPSISASYDVRPALRCCRQGVEVFHSQRDRAWLGLGTTLFGTSDGTRSTAAGRVGFHVPEDPGADADLYARLHQHPWEESVSWTGNTGGHFGVYQAGYLRAYVVPLILPGYRPVSHP